ncbi:MAG TPA: amidase [Pseudorhodoferax sp.]|nr:amidase [Pseudorhodoferax sp.]
MNGITALREAIAQGRCSAQHALDRQWHAFARGATAHGCVVHQAARQGPVPGGPLSGVALAHKDVFETGERAPALGRPACGARPGPQALALQQPAAQGASYLGALAMAELACGATAENPHAPALRNPLDPAAAVGGSSSGSAVAVAAGLCQASLGTDTAGSVRIPAATCGLVGLRPGQQRISAQGVAPLAPSLDTVGIVAASAEDAAHVLAALDPADRTLVDALQQPQGLAQLLARPRAWRLASALAQDDLDDAVRAVLARFGAQASAGATLWRHTGLHGLDALAGLAQVVLHVEAAATHAPLAQRAPQTLAPLTQAILWPGWAMPVAWYRHALASRAARCADFIAACFGDADLLLLPALPHSVPDADAVTTGSARFDARALAALHRYQAFVNYLDLPAIVFPVGKDPQGRPVSVQALARPGAETALLAFAHQFALPPRA